MKDTEDTQTSKQKAKKKYYAILLIKLSQCGELSNFLGERKGSVLISYNT